MFGNLIIEMKNKKISQAQIAKVIGVSTTSTNYKLNGKRDFTSDEMFAIKNNFFPDKSLEYLFKRNI